LIYKEKMFNRGLLFVNLTTSTDQPYTLLSKPDVALPLISPESIKAGFGFSYPLFLSASER